MCWQCWNLRKQLNNVQDYPGLSLLDDVWFVYCELYRIVIIHNNPKLESLRSNSYFTEWRGSTLFNLVYVPLTMWIVANAVTQSSWLDNPIDILWVPLSAVDLVRLLQLSMFDWFIGGNCLVPCIFIPDWDDGSIWVLNICVWNGYLLVQ